MVMMAFLVSIDLCAKQLDENEAVILATKVTDTIKIVDNEGFIKETPDRNYLWAAQTPQGFLVDLSLIHI